MKWEDSNYFVPVPRQSSAYIALFDADYSSIVFLHNISDYSNPNYILSLLSQVKVVLVCDTLLQG